MATIILVACSSTRNSAGTPISTPTPGVESRGNSPTTAETTERGVSRSPDWSPDGKELAFEGDPDGEGPFQIFTVGVDGFGLTRIVDVGFAPAWSPDGSHIAFASDSHSGDIYVIERSGANAKQITDSDYSDYCPAWSPDGERIAFFSYRGGFEEPRSAIYVINADGSDERRVTAEAWTIGCPAWSPDGTLIAFEADFDGVWGLYLIRSDGGEPWILVEGGRNASWSPGGDQLVLEGGGLYSGRLTLVEVDGSDVRPLTEFAASNPAWSPDGLLIAFEDEGEGPFERQIYLVKPDGSELRQLTRSDSLPSRRSR